MSNKLNDTFIFLSSIGFSLTSAQTLKEPLKERRVIWQMIVYVAKWCRGVKTGAMLDRVNPRHAKWIDVKLHEAAVRWCNEMMFVKTIIDDLRIPVTLTDILKPQRDKMLMLIDKMRHYGSKRRNIQKAKRELLNTLNNAKSIREKLEDENERARRFYRQEEAKRQSEMVEVQRILAKDKENKIFLEQVRQSKLAAKQKFKNLLFKKDELNVRLAIKRQTIETKKRELERLRGEYLKCIPNIEQSLEIQKKSEQQLSAKIDAEVHENLSRYNMFKERLETLQQEMQKELESVEEASHLLRNNVMVLMSIAGISETQQRKLNGGAAIVDERMQLESAIEELSQRIAQTELAAVTAESSAATIQQATFEIRERFAREVASYSRLKQTKRIVEEEEKRMNEEIQQVRRNFLQREDKLRSRIVEYAKSIVTMQNGIYKDIREISKAYDK